MTTILYILTLLTLVVITIQDFRERVVYWFLYPIVALLVFSIQILINPIYIVFTNSLSNLILVTILLFFAYLYSKIRLKKTLINETLGLGDVLFFIAISFAFAPISFLILLVFSLLFSLAIHLFLNIKKNEATVPLAGYMALFFGIVFTLVFFTKDFSLYAY